MKNQLNNSKLYLRSEFDIIESKDSYGRTLFVEKRSQRSSPYTRDTLNSLLLLLQSSRTFTKVPVKSFYLEGYLSTHCQDKLKIGRDSALLLHGTVTIDNNTCFDGYYRIILPNILANFNSNWLDSPLTKPEDIESLSSITFSKFKISTWAHNHMSISKCKGRYIPASPALWDTLRIPSEGNTLRP